MLYENLQVRLATGETVDIGELQKIDAALAEIRRVVAPPPNVHIEIVGSDVDRCPQCGFEAPSKAPNPLPDPHRQIGRTTDRASPDALGRSDDPSPPLPTDESAVVEIAPKPLWAEHGFVPSQPFGDGAPTAPDHGREVWRPYARQGNGYGPDPSPYHVLHTPGHPLPPIPEGSK
jgi:hypothetical protein